MTVPASPLSPLIGRDRELAILREHLADALAGRGSLVLIGGEAGIGKTTLAEALCREATQQDALVLVGRCYDLSETPPYGPWVELFVRFKRHDDAPPLPEVFAHRGTAGEVASQAALFQQVTDFLVALAARPLVLLLDDLHWSDPASLALLRFVARALPDAPILLVATYRVDALTRHHPLYALVPLLVRESRATRLDLQPLAAAALHALVAARYDLPPGDEARLVAYLGGRAEGNPLFVGEVLRTLEESHVLRRDGDGWILRDPSGTPVPALLRQVIDGRVARLDGGVQVLLDVASVIGQAIPLALWAAIADTTEDALLTTVEPARASGLLVEAPDGVAMRFSHALIRETVYEGVAPAQRRRLHRRIGEVTAAMPDAHPDTVAYHFRSAGDARATGWLMQAGERALASYAYATAEARFGQALPASAGVERAMALFYLSCIHRYDEGGIREAEEAMRVATEAGDPTLAALARIRLGASLAYRGGIGRGIAELTAGNAVLDALPESALARFAHASAATFLSPADRRAALTSAYALGGCFAKAMAGLGSTVDEALTRLDTLPVSARATLGFVCSALGRGRDARDAWMSASAAMAAQEAWGRVTAACLTLLEEAYLPYFADDLTERARLAAEMERALARRAARGDASPQVEVLWPLLVLEGQWAEARSRWAASTEGAGYRILSAPHIGMLARAQGEREVAWGLVREALPAGPAMAPGTTLYTQMTAMQRLAATLALDEGDLPTAKEWLGAHDHWLAWSGAVRGQTEGQLGWAQYFRAAGDPTRADDHARQALAHATDPRQPLALLAAHRLLGELDTDAHRFADAQTHLETALALADACAASYERALTLLALAELHGATGGSGAAAALLDDVRAICTSLGAQPALARADAIAARLAIARTPHLRYPAGLSAREVEVLRLVADGLTNAQVAERLFLSPRTINAHLTTIYSKLAVPSRAAAIRFALDHGLR